MSVRDVRAAVAVVALAVPGYGSASAQNLLVNPDFDAGLASWTPRLVGFASVGYDGSSGSPAPGSATLFAAYSDQFAVAALGQCTAVAAPGEVELLARFQDVSGLAPSRAVQATFHAGPSCAGTALATVAQNAFTDLPDGWTEIMRLNHPLPPGTQSAWIEILVAADAIGDFNQVRFDHVRFGPAGTTPVALERFSVE